MRFDIHIAAGPFDPETEAAKFRSRCREAGAIVSFTGQVRADAGADTLLTLDHYPGFTEKEIARFVEEARGRWALEGALIIHRVGEMSAGDAIVLVATAAQHRRAAFEAADFLMDHLKSQAPFWKRERTAAGERWVEPRSSDHCDLDRWSEKA